MWQKFMMKQQLHRHEKIHTGDKQYICGECNMKFVQKTNLVEHMKVHTGEKLFACGTCKREFRRRTHLKTHVENNSCFFFFKNLVPKIIEKRFPCEVCEKKFGTNGHLKRHRINVHKFPKSYIPLPIDNRIGRGEEKIQKADEVRKNEVVDDLWDIDAVFQRMLLNIIGLLKRELGRKKDTENIFLFEHRALISYVDF